MLEHRGLLPNPRIEVDPGGWLTRPLAVTTLRAANLGLAKARSGNQFHPLPDVRDCSHCKARCASRCRSGSAKANNFFFTTREKYSLSVFVIAFPRNLL